MQREKAPAERVADIIARDLFTNNWGEHAERLVLEAPDEHFKSKFGGWSERGLADRIEELLSQVHDDGDL